MENAYFKDESPKKGSGFIAAIIALILFTIMGIGIDIDQYLQTKDQDLTIPLWYFYLIFSVDAALILAVILIYVYRKAGVLLFPIAMALHFFFHLYYLDTFLYSDVTGLFVFVGGLLAILPKWQFFK
ncbi:hypothetical protein [Bergeyella sp. RCAD1439]|uniref:hypothetical protein n=1 Tax=Bergeyella anatis TaxID=3113737 RepID=UPI002E16F19E|nr:hypothetical protein [Bergeyella sp. RCAD1439]